MKRWLIVIVIFLLAGAVVNVAVAWGCALWIDIEGHSRFAAGRPMQLYEHAGWDVYILRTPGAIRVLRSIQADYIAEKARESIARDFPDLPLDRTVQQHPTDRSGPPRGLPKWSDANDSPLWTPILPSYPIEDARGLPLHSLRCAIDLLTILVRQEDAPFLNRMMPTGVEIPLAPGDAVSGGILISAHRISPGKYDIRAIPFRPIWPGFAVNTIFYAVVLWMLIPGPFVLRRFIRVKRGRCVKCGYPMGESDVCSECGKSLPERVKAAT